MLPSFDVTVRRSAYASHCNCYTASLQLYGYYFRIGNYVESLITNCKRSCLLNYLIRDLFIIPFNFFS